MYRVKVTSYNCRKLPKSFSELHTRPYILHVFNNNDIIALQETWLAKQDLHLCDNLHPDFLSCGVSAVDYSDRILIGRPHGGVSFFFSKRISNFVTPMMRFV